MVSNYSVFDSVHVFHSFCCFFLPLLETSLKISAVDIIRVLKRFSLLLPRNLFLFQFCRGKQKTLKKSEDG